MAEHLEFGKRGENFGINYLTERGFAVLSTNWRKHRYEIDIIALKDGITHFIEVKIRHIRIGDVVTDFSARGAVSEKKLSHLIKGVQFYVDSIGVDGGVSLDLLAIDVDARDEFSVYFYENFQEC